MSSPKKILSWYFAPNDMLTVPHPTSKKRLSIAQGYIYSTDEPRIIPCQSGQHGSLHPFDALGYATGSVLCRTAQWGEVKYHGNPPDKLASRYREFLFVRNIERELRLFACKCARKNWNLLNDSSKNLVEMSEKFANGLITRKKLDSARASAWDSALASARDSALASAWDSAWASARDSAWDSAWDSAQKIMRNEFEQMCIDIYTGKKIE